MTQTDRNPDAPYGVICYENPLGEQGCGKQGLTTENYNAQMTRPDSLWRCPICGMDAQWDDDRYEESLS